VPESAADKYLSATHKHLEQSDVTRDTDSAEDATAKAQATYFEAATGSVTRRVTVTVCCVTGRRPGCVPRCVLRGPRL
jgi:hypothetical protein